MRWLGYVVGLLVGTVFGFWVHDFWEGDLTGIGTPPPPSFDLYVPLALFVLGTIAVGMIGRNRDD